ncbi:MAG: 50S ribosomal protein L6 [Candidatus Omnitrophota bacterium]
MSRLEKKAVTVPKDVNVQLSGNNLDVQGPKGKLSRLFSGEFLDIELKDGRIKLLGDFNKKVVKAQAGLTFALINNMIKGVSEGYSKQLEIVGVGYRAQVQDKNLNLQLRFSHPVVFSIPEGIKIETPKPTQIVIQGIDKEKVGAVAARIRAILPPEPYKGKGIRYAGEYVRRKLGKTITK